MANRVRLTFTSAEVGNGNPLDSNMLPGQDGGLAVRVQAEDEGGNPVGPVTRSSDEGITFGPVPGVTFTVRDLVSGVRHGDSFTRVILGTQGNDVLSPSGPAADDDGPIYVNLGQGDDNTVGTNADDILIGGAGNDRFIAGGGDDLIDGGPGFDTAIFTTRFADTRLIQGGSTTIFSGTEGIDTLTDIDRFEFSDITIGFRPDVYSTLQTGRDSDGVQVAALYDGILGREVDASGLAFFTDLLDAGLTPEQVANTLLNSGEYRVRFGLSDSGSNESFVTKLYQVALGREPDQGGLKAHVGALDRGVSRAEIAASIALSEENFIGLTVDETGILVPDANTAAVARLYFGLLDRAPDVGGLENFASFVDAGATLGQAAEAIYRSEEGQAKIAGRSDGDVLIDVFENTTGRDMDSRSFAELLTALRLGGSPSEIAASYAQSAEAQVHFAPVIEQGWVLV